MALELWPISLALANRFIAAHHRHHKPVQGHKFSIGAYLDGELVGAVVCGRPVARMVDANRVLEVTRLCTDGTRNACSLLYAAAARAAAAMGYEKIQTYILESETGASLKAAGWELDGFTVGAQWVHTDGHPRRTDQPICDKQRWARQLNEHTHDPLSFTEDALEPQLVMFGV